MAKIIPLVYAGQPVQFDEGGWFNATVAAARFGKRPVDWLKLDGTQEYIRAVADIRKCAESSLLRTRRGNAGGTWMHPRLAVRFAQWLDVRFAVWCDEQLDALLRGTHPRFDQQRLRQEAAASYRVMSEIIRITRERQGKLTEAKHYINEARLVAWAVTDEFAPLDRSSLSASDLALLIQLEELNACLAGAGLGYPDRKQALERHAREHRAERLALLGQSVLAAGMQACA